MTFYSTCPLNDAKESCLSSAWDTSSAEMYLVFHVVNVVSGFPLIYKASIDTTQIMLKSLKKFMVG